MPIVKTLLKIIHSELLCIIECQQGTISAPIGYLTMSRDIFNHHDRTAPCNKELPSQKYWEYWG